MQKGERKGRRLRGFALMSVERRLAVARKGGQTSHARGTAHRWTAKEARAAGKKNRVSHPLRRAELRQDAGT